MEIVEKDGIYHVRGPILEDVDVRAMPKFKAGRIELDLSAVSAISSVGLRSFIQWIAANKLNPSYHNCSIPFVMQLNMVHELVRPGVRVQSFAVPVSCKKCGKTMTLTYVADRDFVPGSGLVIEDRPPDVVPGCELEFDCNEDTYFFFIRFLEKV